MLLLFLMMTIIGENGKKEATITMLQREGCGKSAIESSQNEKAMLERCERKKRSQVVLNVCEYAEGTKQQ